MTLRALENLEKNQFARPINYRLAPMRICYVHDFLAAETTMRFSDTMSRAGCRSTRMNARKVIDQG
jgi:hypothetical protein